MHTTKLELIAKRDALIAECDNIVEFFRTPAFHELSSVERYLLRAHYFSLGAVVEMLEARIAACDVPKPTPKPAEQPQPQLFTPHPVGTILRYSDGSTALFRVDGVKDANDPLRCRYYGVQYLGGAIVMHHTVCTVASDADMETWNRKAAERVPRQPYNVNALATFNGERMRGIVHTDEYKAAMRIMQDEFNHRYHEDPANVSD